jgi:hypothetical protein
MRPSPRCIKSSARHGFVAGYRFEARRGDPTLTADGGLERFTLDQCRDMGEALFGS